MKSSAKNTDDHNDILRRHRYSARSMTASPTTLIRQIVPADLPQVLDLNEANVPAVGSLDAERLAALVSESPIALNAMTEPSLRPSTVSEPTRW